MECTLKEGELIHQTQLRRIVSTYLVHYGYCATAEQFNKNAESVYADELNSMHNRQRTRRRAVILQMQHL